MPNKDIYTSNIALKALVKEFNETRDKDLSNKEKEVIPDNYTVIRARQPKGLMATHPHLYIKKSDEQE